MRPAQQKTNFLCIALVFAFVTVSSQTFRAASADPVETLCYE
jgi:hypothetical protein